jgi:CheY-like chemotaxis protein
MKKRPVVLVIEDNPPNLELVQFLLEESGWTVRTAMTAEEGRRAVGESIPDLILMDVLLPDEDGLTLAQEFRTRKGLESLPIIALTAHAMRGDRERFLAGGFTGYLSKPIEVSRFVGEVRSFLEGDAEEEE